jgi:hypothetical protein
MPISEPVYLRRGDTPRGVNRGSMITEPSADELARWLLHNGLISEIVAV